MCDNIDNDCDGAIDESLSCDQNDVFDLALQKTAPSGLYDAGDEVIYTIKVINQ